ncbi:hypothetical protein DFJ77DRAFT_520020 [Powellomyces hirtus]|nr:hypothetical protein DFJ77DRAFT_520020 [Powellomyces hirtus]
MSMRMWVVQDVANAPRPLTIAKVGQMSWLKTALQPDAANVLSNAICLITDSFAKVVNATENLNHTIVSSHNKLVRSLKTGSIVIGNAAGAVLEVDEPVCEKVRARDVLDSMAAAVNAGWLICDEGRTMVTGDFAPYLRHYMEQKADFNWRIRKKGPKKALDYILQEIDKSGAHALEYRFQTAIQPNASTQASRGAPTASLAGGSRMDTRLHLMKELSILPFLHLFRSLPSLERLFYTAAFCPIP